jgi:predicted DCC family thiol-disulfide oxidoreductase YuxK
MAIHRPCYSDSDVPPFAQKTETLFYDGHCALCHNTVKFVIKRDRSGAAFRFAPLEGETFQALVPLEQRAGLPDSIVIRTADGSLLARSDAVVRILERLGGGWRILAALLAAIPRGLRDGVYDFIARVRYRIFGKRDELCPIVPPALRQRFDP